MQSTTRIDDVRDALITNEMIITTERRGGCCSCCRRGPSCRVYTVGIALLMMIDAIKIFFFAFQATFFVSYDVEKFLRISIFKIAICVAGMRLRSLFSINIKKNLNVSHLVKP